MKRYLITYEKKFLSGILEGITVPCNFPVPEDAAARHVQYLERCTEQSPGRDSLTRDKYVINRIRVEEQ